MEKLQEQMQEQGIGGALIVQRVDLFYFSGTAQDAHLLSPRKAVHSFWSGETCSGPVQK